MITLDDLIRMQTEQHPIYLDQYDAFINNLICLIKDKQTDELVDYLNQLDHDAKAMIYYQLLRIKDVCRLYDNMNGLFCLVEFDVGDVRNKERWKINHYILS